MTLLLPNIDDRTWSDLTAEGTALIPVYGPEWTDQNYSDPGITLVELLAFIAEMDIYQLNQISARDRRRFLALVDVLPGPPKPARAVLQITLAAGTTTNPALPQGLQFEGTNPAGVKTLFQLTQQTTLASGGVSALQYWDASGYQNLTPLQRRGSPFNPFGTAPHPGSTFYVGLTSPLPAGKPVQIHFTFAGGKSGIAERKRLVCEPEERARHCPPKTANSCCATAPAPANALSILKHYGVRTVWEYQPASGSGEWIALDPTQGSVTDNTRSFTLDGAVTFCLPGDMASSQLGAAGGSYYYLRCRIAAGSYDAAPLLQSLAYNGAYVEQSIPAASTLTIDPSATITYSTGSFPKPYEPVVLNLTLDDRRWVTQLRVGGGSANDPQFRVLNFQPPASGTAGSLCFGAAFLGFGDGLPEQQFVLPDSPVEPNTIQLYTLENSLWKSWDLRLDFDSSTRKDNHAVIDPTLGTLTFGTGEKGRVPPLACELFAVYAATRAQAGNLSANAINTLADTPYNHALLYDPTTGTDGWATLRQQIGVVSNPLPAWGGAAEETVAHAAGRATQLVEVTGRAVTTADYERLALSTPGTQIARVTAIANLHPAFPCYKAPGMITVIVLPYLPQGSPLPTPGLLDVVSAYLRPRHVIGTRVEVVGPTYVTVAVQVTVQSIGSASKSGLPEMITTAINKFFDPITGGPDGTGWPFGRDVYRAEIMKVIGTVSGVDYIVSLALVVDGGQPQCGNVCLGPTWLVKAGTHQVSVV